MYVLCSQPATGLPPPVGLPPQRGRGSHECPRARMLAVWRPGYSGGRYSRSTFGAPCNDGGSRHRDPRRASTASGPGGRGLPEYWLGLAQTPSTPTQRQKETGTKLLIES